MIPIKKIYPAAPNADDCVKAITKVLEELVGLPKHVYSDDGGEFKAKEFADKMKYYDVEHQFSRTPPALLKGLSEQ